MYDLLCVPLKDYHLFTNRRTGLSVKFLQAHATGLRALYNSRSTTIPDWLNRTLSNIGFTFTESKVLWETLVYRTSLGEFASASFEITEHCNFRCAHCYLGEKKKRGLGIDDRKYILDVLEKAGCIWLQLTGGEPLIDSFFIDTYSYAFSLGFMISISTNGSLLSQPGILETFKMYPPNRVTVSLYGASERSHNSLIKSNVPLQSVIDGIKFSQDADIRLRVNIIMTRYNENELEELIRIPESMGIEYHVYHNIQPTVDADLKPLEVQALCPRIVNPDNENNFDINISSMYWSERCNAGKNFFHVNADGVASICKVARLPSVELLQNGLTALKELKGKRDTVLNESVNCKKCPDFYTCTSCPPMLALYCNEQNIPSTVCSQPSLYRKGVSNV